MIRFVSIVLEQREQGGVTCCCCYCFCCCLFRAASSLPLRRRIHPSIHPSIIRPSVHPSISTARPQNLPGAASLSVASCLGDERPRDAPKRTHSLRWPVLLFV
ncbi:hypothetical protein GGI35DRAFT_254314 [Trichoderma velutinum]